MNAYGDVDGIDGPFERAMEKAMREDAAAAEQGRLRALFEEGRPHALRFSRVRRGKPALIGDWSQLINVDLDLLRTAKRKWMVWDGVDRLSFILSNGFALYVRTEPAEEGQDANVVTFRLHAPSAVKWAGGRA